MLFGDDLGSALGALEPTARNFFEMLADRPYLIGALAAFGLTSALVIAFHLIASLLKAAASGLRLARASAIRATKDHRALVLIGRVGGGRGGEVRQFISEAVQAHFANFAFDAPVQVRFFDLSLPTQLPKNPIARKLEAARLRRVIAATGADLFIWGKASGQSVQLRLSDAAPENAEHEPLIFNFFWRPASPPPKGVPEAIAYCAARRVRPVLNRPADYRPEKLLPIGVKMEWLAGHSPGGLNAEACREIADDFATGALSLGERGGDGKWLNAALAVRQKGLAEIDRARRPDAWGAAQQEVGRALAMIGEKEGSREKLEQAVETLRLSLDALRATPSLQAAENAMRALARAEQSLAQRRRMGLRWPAA